VQSTFPWPSAALRPRARIAALLKLHQVCRANSA
jgi:hypothetical protein